ncbi:MAG: hypothetical protein GC160_26675 [Acidobacteria bacterium]|nr:hypothetical protein [Acidobacteriota bacterium]
MKGELYQQLRPIGLILLGLICVQGAWAAENGRPAPANQTDSDRAQAAPNGKADSAASAKPKSTENPAKPSGEKTAAAEQSGAEGQTAEQAPIDRAISVFRKVTEEQGLRPGSARSGKRSAGPAPSWHGRVYEYIRNNSLDAVPHEVTQRGGNRNILRRNQFGFSVSGPVLIPKLYDGRRSTFFTLSYEGTRESEGQSYLLTLPTAPQRAGDFADLVNKAGDRLTVYDPASTHLNSAYDSTQPVSASNLQYARNPFPNNKIPVTRLDPVALAMAKEQPLPNTSVGPFLQNNYWTNPPQQNMPDGILAKVDHSLFERHKLTFDLASSNGFQGQPKLYQTIGNPGSPDRTFVDRRVQLRETYSISPSMIYQANFTAASQVVDALPVEQDENVPQELGLGGVSGSAFPTIRLNGVYGLGAPNGSYRRNAWNRYETSHQLTLRQGKHSWLGSIGLSRYQLNTFEQESPSGYFTFSESQTGLPGINNTGSSYASFLLGRSETAQVTDIVQPSYLRKTVVGTTLRDEVEVSSNLTLTLSMGLNIEGPRVEKYDRQSTIDLNAINPENERPGALVFATKDGYGRAFQPIRAKLEPRVGLAWSPTAKRNTVVRGAFYQYYTQNPLRTGPFGTQGYSAFRNFVSPNRQLTPAAVLGDGLPEPQYPLPDLRPDAANNTNADLIPQTGRTPRYHYGYLSVERRLPFGMTVRARGTSYRGKNMLMDGDELGLNRPSLDVLQYRDLLNTEAFRRTLRPYPQYQQIQLDNQYPGGKYLYDLGDFSLEKRTGQGLSFDFGYQFLRRYDDYSGPSIQDPYDRASAWARTRGNRPHRVSFNYVYELPFGDGKSLLNHAGLLSKIVGDWSLSGFTSWMSGDPIVLTPSFNNTGGIVQGLRVDSVDGVDPQVADQGPAMWFNPAAFINPADFTVGDVPRTHPTLRNPSWQNHDLAISKRLPISSEKSLELLLQSFNFLNKANWNDPDSEIGTADVPNVNAGRIIGSRGGRVLQLGMRYNF